MAAVLCGGCKNCCKGLSEACGKLCSLPCKICEPICDGLSKLCCSPFSGYLILTLALNVPPIAFTIKNVLVGAGQCPAMTWLYVDSAFCGINIIGAFYIAAVISDDTGTAAGRSDMGDSSACERAKYVLCDDPRMAVFLLIRGAFVFWLFAGLSSLASYKGCKDIIVGNPVLAAMGCGFAFLGIGCCFLSVSLCCANRGRRYDPKSFAHQYAKEKVAKSPDGPEPSAPVAVVVQAVVVEENDGFAAEEDSKKQQVNQNSNQASNNNSKMKRSPFAVIW